ncbi:hypothetical protein [Sedimentisphaera salicampi]|uniref:Uncharacterized protein n=1 Tax=Sedimentisphaera salicampi TaxID=1941349 RepID=A0A1W6LLM1_9BACT|nr:hypothetical protein [Sedimentisphaera salicampi]ARN56643.1 hypothetical protein STSP1_01031 [Sedimentisphaera salicampi]OXU15214.1 hypothetical protein SMSP1_01018 [Sedimentisphaera salicampi]
MGRSVISLLVLLAVSVQCISKQADPRDKCRELPDKELKPIKLKVLCEKDILGERNCRENLRQKKHAQQTLFVDKVFCRSFFTVLNPYLPEKEFLPEKQLLNFDTRFTKEAKEPFSIPIPEIYSKDETILEL